MKKTLFLISAIACAAAIQFTSPLSARAQQGQGSGSAQSVAATSGAGHSAENSQKFEERKSKISERVANRIAKLQQIQSCVQSATTGKALRACLPKRKNHGRWDKDGHRDARQHENRQGSGQ